ncbi:hypothetical protein C7S18_23370 [Ahniella affigens]|uniref:Methyltransferase domain-containing protein n=1 Tax=Ahniella affigens TaxID=2021234 RepID=A0A2P1PYL9_9GAMM|nr:methyltransferase domain-containing protein [Ahniella affigens]AVP99935.1 hypothetical protein C7S18_23370 [Ahniella affigens]
MVIKTDKLKATLKARRAQAETAWTFFQQWLKAPLTTAAISPSSKELAAEMMREVPKDSKYVVELGGGTGVFTEALLEHGIAGERLLVFELNETLHLHLRTRFPQANVVCADARELPKVVEQAHFCAPGEVDVIVSGLGLLSMSKELQQDILEAAFAVLAPQGRLVQFTYGPTCPVKREVMKALGLHARRTGWTIWNVPPASVYVIKRSVAKRVKAVRA